MLAWNDHVFFCVIICMWLSSSSTTVIRQRNRNQFSILICNHTWFVHDMWKIRTDTEWQVSGDTNIINICCVVEVLMLLWLLLLLLYFRRFSFSIRNIVYNETENLFRVPCFALRWVSKWLWWRRLRVRVFNVFACARARSLAHTQKRAFAYYVSYSQTLIQINRNKFEKIISWHRLKLVENIPTNAVFAHFPFLDLNWK